MTAGSPPLSATVATRLRLERSIPSSYCQGWQSRGNILEWEKKQHAAAGRGGDYPNSAIDSTNRTKSTCREIGSLW